MAGRGISLSTKGAGPGSGRDEKWCRPCDLDLGEKRKAHRIMAKGGGRCEEHYRYESGQPQRTPEAQAFIERWKRVVSTRPRDLDGADIVSSEHGSVSPQPDFVSDEEEEQPMGRQGRKLDIVVLAEIRKDSEAGMSINAIATKHGVSWPTVKSVLGGVKMERPKTARRRMVTPQRTAEPRRVLLRMAPQASRSA